MTKVAFIAARESGAVEMRAKQIASQRENWVYSDQPTDADLHVIVKWPGDWEIETPVIYDCCDFWKQPQESVFYTSETSAKNLWKQVREAVNPDSVIFSNRRMFDILGEKNDTFIYHHHDPRLTPNEVRKIPTVVGYMGNPNYLGEWGPTITKAAQMLGMTFKVNPNPREIDIGISMRGTLYRNYLEKTFKSNVKLANWYALGIPCLMWPEWSVIETAIDPVRLFEDVDSMGEQMAELVDYDLRKSISERFVLESKTYHLDTIANQYEKYIASRIEANSVGTSEEDTARLSA